MNVRLPKTVKELYTLVDKCAWMEEGKKLLERKIASMLIQRMKMNQLARGRARSSIRSQGIKQ